MPKNPKKFHRFLLPKGQDRWYNDRKEVFPMGRPLRSFFILGAPQPPPEDGPPPKGNRGEGWNCLQGCGLFQGEVEDSPPSNGDLREVPLRGKG